MPKVLILGAGASFGHGHGTAAADRTPLVNGFFSHPLFAALRNDYKKLMSYLQETFGADMETLDSVDLEALIGQLEPLWSLHILDRKASSKFEYDEQFEVANPIELLRSFIADVIFLSTKWLSMAECPHHDQLVRSWLSEGDTVISFNYDLIFDTSLRRHSTWTETTGYGWNAKDRPKSYVEEGWSEREREYVPANIQLLKPHGSLNFSRCMRTRAKNKTAQSHLYITGKTEEKTERKKEEYESIAVTPVNEFWTRFQPRYLPSLCMQYSEEFNCSQKEFFQMLKYANKGKDTYEMGILPLMIVPTPYKPFEQMTFGELRDIWRQAFKSLQKAEQAISCGFSFRDDHFNQIMREATRKRDDSLDLRIVDPSSEALDEIAKRLSGCKLNIIPIVKSLGDFVQTFN